jgi:hypothetical protein
MIAEAHIYATAGLDYVYNSSLSFVDVSRVTMEGVSYNVSTTLIGNLIVRYSASEGKIYFNNTFNGGEKVNIIYKK